MARSKRDYSTAQTVNATLCGLPVSWLVRDAGRQVEYAVCRKHNAWASARVFEHSHKVPHRVVVYDAELPVTRRTWISGCIAPAEAM